MDSEDPNLIDCPRCGAQVSMTWSSCPKCGLSFYPDEDPDERADRRQPHRAAAGLSWTARSLVTLLVIGGLLGAVTGLSLGLNWIGMMLGGILVCLIGWGAWDWLRRRSL